MSEAEWFGPASYGKRLDSGFPEGTLAFLDTQWEAKPERVETARLFFREVELSDFEPLGTTGRRWLHRETQREYLTEESQLLEMEDPRSTGVTYFCVHGWRILFFKPRPEPVKHAGLHEAVRGGRLARGADGRDVWVPTKQTGSYDPDYVWVKP